MASAQVLPNSRKQEHLEAGKRRLEEFRKKKAAEKAKKVVPATLVPASTADNNEKLLSDTDIVLGPDSDRVGTYSVGDITDNQLYTEETAKGGNTSIFAPANKLVSDTDANVQSVPSVNGIDSLGSNAAYTNGTKPVHKVYEGLGSPVDFSYRENEGDDLKSGLGLSRASSGFSSDRSIAVPKQGGHGTDEMSSEFSFSGKVETLPWESSGSLKNVMSAATNFSTDQDANVFSLSSSSLMAPFHLPLHSSNIETQPRRSRPSFLDSLNVPRASPVLPLKSTPSEESVSSSNFNGLDALESSATSRYSSDPHLAPVSRPSKDLYQFPTVPPSSSVYTNNIQGMKSNFNEPNMERKPEFLRPKPNEDFFALEQHIEDLTQEKFSLQRSLEASSTLAESLAAENTSLTDSYNQQRNAVNHLKEEMEKLQAEINAQLVELEDMKNAYANAQLECNAADERSKLLASEVIGLEEKALRLRSNELKLERQLENSHAEISSYKKKVSSLEKERQDLQSTISALQEEKKMLQSKVRKASSSGNSIDMNQTGIKRKEMSTSTEDLDMDIEQAVAARLLNGSEASSFPLSDGGQTNLEATSFIPNDQMRTIVNINTLISELAFEKEELLKALESERADNINVKGLNKELSRKLEAQTQRLELLTAQSMAPEILTARLRETPTVMENTPYADEGDEVVERVLGWIMKLFPGGPSRRRPGKHL